MIAVRKAEERGHLNHGWLDTYHTFSFGQYYDPDFMGFRALRVINDDYVAPGMGFGEHGHSNMEIITYVLEGKLEHKDSLGTGDVLTPGEVQYMSAGSGIRHSEFNSSRADKLHLLQIWLEPAKLGVPPSYDQKRYPISDENNKAHLVASADGRDGSLKFHADADVFAAKLDEGKSFTHVFTTRKYGWLHIATGTVTVDGAVLKAGDALALSEEKALTVTGGEGGGEVLLFDLA